MTRTKEIDIKKLVYMTAMRTLAVLMVLLILVFSLFTLFSPFKAGSLLFSLGFKGLAANVTLMGAEDTKEFGDYFTAFSRAVAAKNYKTAIAAGGSIWAFGYDDYTSKIYQQNQTSSSGSSLEADNYFKYNYIYSLVARNKGGSKQIFDKAKELSRVYKDATSYHYKVYGAMSGYVAALADNKRFDIGNIMEWLEEIYTAESSEWNHSYYDSATKLNSAQVMCLDAVKIIKSRNLAQDVIDKWDVYCKDRNLTIDW